MDKKSNYKKNNTRGGVLVLEGVFETGKIRLVDCFFSFGFLTTFTVTQVRCPCDFLSITSCTYVFMEINILIMITVPLACFHLNHDSFAPIT